MRSLVLLGSTIFLLIAPANAQGLPSANDPRIFTEAICLSCPDGTCPALVTVPLEVSIEGEGNRELRQYGIFTRPEGEFDRPARDGAVASDWATATIIHGPSTTTPEPAGMILLGSGLAGLAAIRKRRRSGSP